MLLTEQAADIMSLLVLRIFAKKKKGMISPGDFDMLAEFGAHQALAIVTNKHRRQYLEEVVIGELRKTLELISQKGCGSCLGTGFSDRHGSRLTICKCVNMVHYRGDAALPLGEQYSNEYFTDEFSKDALGKKDIVTRISSAVRYFLGA